MSNTQSLQPEIIPLDSNLIHLANYNSFNGFDIEWVQSISERYAKYL